MLDTGECSCVVQREKGGEVTSRSVCISVLSALLGFPYYTMIASHHCHCKQLKLVMRGKKVQTFERKASKF